jgi:hypothetical protein
MEEHLPNSPDRPSRGPEPERLFAGEVDLTGATPQPDVLRDVIGDAITEAENGGLPDWGARVIARALANRQRSFGALHQFAATGRIDRAAMARQLVEIYASTSADDDETREWINWLGSYVVNLVEPESDTSEERPAASVDGDQRAETCGDAGNATTEAALTQGIRVHGDAFRAFLQLDGRRDDEEPLHTFNQCYVGAYASMDNLLRELTPVGECEEVVAYVTKVLGFEGLMAIDWAGIEYAARQAWDIVSYGGKLYVFAKHRN